VTWLLLIPTMAAVAAAAWPPRRPAAETISSALGLGEPEERQETPECPSWCAEQPGHQTGHHALIGARHAQGGTWMQVELIQPADQEAQVHLGVYPSLDEPGLEAHLTPLEAAVMAALIAADGTPDGHDWLARALAEAAQAAGAPRCQDCGRIGADVHPEYDRQGRVSRCGACHQAALAGLGVAR